MSDRTRIGLDNAAFRGRLRQPTGGAQSFRIASQPQIRPSARYFDQVLTRSAAPITWVITPSFGPPQLRQPTPSLRQQLMPDHVSMDATAAAPPFAIVEPQPFAVPARLKQQRSHVLKRQLVRLPGRNSVAPAYRPRRHTKLQLAMVGMACFLFLFGLAVSIQTLQTNHAAAAQVSALSKQADNKPSTSDQSTATSSVPVPSTTKPTASAVSQYVVAPDMARYLKIPKLGVDARVLQVGINSSGALGTPNNVFDTAWYTGSAKPGQAGATLIDGHVSSWTSHGVFYGIKTLVAGDAIQIVRGDGSVVNYQVVKTQVYAANDVDMQAAVNPITPGKSGLNLITCTGDVEKGTSEFTQRVIVFAQQV